MKRLCTRNTLNTRAAGLCLLLLPSSLAAAPALDAPVSGWRHSQGERTVFRQPVNYPASSVNVPEGTPDGSLIRGRIREHVKDGKPATLVVNGVAMPLRIEDDGGFARPYAFGSGANGVEIRHRGARVRSQFYENYSGKTQSRIRVVLSWDSDMTDLDLHVVTPDGGHCFYGNPQLANGGALDVDVTTGYGPEIFATPAPLKGNYLVYINYYGGNGGEDMTVARVSIVTHENTPDEKRDVVDVPLRKPGELTLVGRFVFP